MHSHKSQVKFRFTVDTLSGGLGGGGSKMTPPPKKKKILERRRSTHRRVLVSSRLNEGKLCDLWVRTGWGLNFSSAVPRHEDLTLKLQRSPKPVWSSKAQQSCQNFNNNKKYSAYTTREKCPQYRVSLRQGARTSTIISPK